MAIAQTSVSEPLIPSEISTEEAVVVFALSVGILGGAAQLLAGRFLAQREAETVPVRTLVLPVAVAGGSTVVGALLLSRSGA